MVVGRDWDLFKAEPSNFEEACLAKMPRKLYELFIKGYTEKQWGVDATELDKDLAVRITINKPNVNTLTPNHRWNALPNDGYTEMVKNILEGIPVKLEFDYLKNRERVIANKMLVFTGPIDEFFHYKFGRLKYRGQNRKIEYLENIDSFQPCVQVNYPNGDEPRIRTIEWKHLLRDHDRAKIGGTVITHETPFTPHEANHYEYPFPDKINKHLYNEYRREADQLKNTLICGRLGEYKYYDMDQAIGRAMMLASGILEKHNVPSMRYAKAI
jgi:UDP-galactopyranose mutase